MTKFKLSNDNIMKNQKKSDQSKAKLQKGRSYKVSLPVEENLLSDFQVDSGYGKTASFHISRAGKDKSYDVPVGFGFFISVFKKARSMEEIAVVLDNNLINEDIKPIIDYLGLKISDIAKASSVSASTVSRWDSMSPIGVPGSYQFFKMDEIIKKGVDLFGNSKHLKQWLENPNMALGSECPINLLTSMIGLELVDEALDALHFGNVM